MLALLFSSAGNEIQEIFSERITMPLIRFYLSLIAIYTTYRLLSNTAYVHFTSMTFKYI